MKKPFLVQAYTVGTNATQFPFNTKPIALKFARDVFKLDNVYKVKVWDLRISDPVPNIEAHPAMILHLV